MSALIAFRSSQRAATTPDMYSYRDIIDACGLCGKPEQARIIFKVGVKTYISIALNHTQIEAEDNIFRSALNLINLLFLAAISPLWCRSCLVRKLLQIFLCTIAS